MNFFTSVTSQFSKTIDNRLANLSDEEKNKIGTSNYKFNITCSLVKDFTKYSLGAHTDMLAKFVTFLFYLPSDDKLIRNGTSLYKPITNIEGHSHFSDEDTKKNFKMIKTCPFIPNAVLIFPRTNLTFHGVEEINIEQKERDLLQLNYRFQT